MAQDSGHINLNSIMRQQKDMIQLFAAVKRLKMDILLQLIAKSYLLAHASLSKLTRPVFVTVQKEFTVNPNVLKLGESVILQRILFLQC